METSNLPYSFNLGFACGVAFCAGAAIGLGVWAFAIKKGVSNG